MRPSRVARSEMAVSIAVITKTFVGSKGDERCSKGFWIAKSSGAGGCQLADSVR